MTKCPNLIQHPFPQGILRPSVVPMLPLLSPAHLKAGFEKHVTWYLHPKTTGFANKTQLEWFGPGKISTLSKGKSISPQDLRASDMPCLPTCRELKHNATSCSCEAGCICTSRDCHLQRNCSDSEPITAIHHVPVARACQARAFHIDNVADSLPRQQPSVVDGMKLQVRQSLSGARPSLHD